MRRFRILSTDGRETILLTDLASSDIVRQEGKSLHKLYVFAESTQEWEQVYPFVKNAWYI